MPSKGGWTHVPDQGVEDQRGLVGGGVTVHARHDLFLDGVFPRPQPFSKRVSGGAHRLIRCVRAPAPSSRRARRSRQCSGSRGGCTGCGRACGGRCCRWDLCGRRGMPRDARKRQAACARVRHSAMLFFRPTWTVLVGHFHEAGRAGLLRPVELVGGDEQQLVVRAVVDRGRVEVVRLVRPRPRAGSRSPQCEHPRGRCTRSSRAARTGTLKWAVAESPRKIRPMAPELAQNVSSYATPNWCTNTSVTRQIHTLEQCALAQTRRATAGKYLVGAVDAVAVVVDGRVVGGRLAARVHVAARLVAVLAAPVRPCRRSRRGL